MWLYSCTRQNINTCLFGVLALLVALNTISIELTEYYIPAPGSLILSATSARVFCLIFFQVVACERKLLVSAHVSGGIPFYNKYLYWVPHATTLSLYVGLEDPGIFGTYWQSTRAATLLHRHVAGFCTA